MNIRKLLMLSFLLCVCQVTVGAESEKVAEDISAGPIFNNDEAQTKCPTACAKHERTWNGQWTTPPETWGKDSVCGCIHWSYDKQDEWGEYFESCKPGGEQSPINLQEFKDVALPALNFSYEAKGEKVVYNGHTLEVEYEKGGESHIVVDGKNYYLQQFHFHTPSENHVEGEPYAMESHFVHKSDEGKLAVVAVMFEEGNENTSLKAVWDHITALKGMKDAQENKRFKAPVDIELATGFNAMSLLPAGFKKADSYYRFTGSLTTPPCSGDVIWLVMKKPVTVSESQVTEFTELLGHPNNRSLQESTAVVEQ